MNKCTECGSYAINHHCHGRDGSDPELCDVCYWRVRATDFAALEAECERLADELDRKSVITGDYIARCQRLADERDALAAEISDLHTTMMAAAVEIQGHWAAHCDEEGYGPANLMHRLERGIASQYGYTARTLVMVEAERDALAAELAAIKGRGEAVEVVAWQDAENPLYTTAERRVMHEWANNQYPIVELMTVAQHQRILADVCQQRDKLAELLRDVRVIVAREVERWTRAAAILPVNASVESGLLTRIDAALAEVEK